MSVRRRRYAAGAETVLVIGLGRFGAQVADSLTRLGHEVLAVDDNPDTVERWSHRFTHVVQADATDGEALRQLGVTDFQRAVVAIGTAVEQSVLSVLALAELGLPEIWGRATSEQHAKILSAVGAHHVIFPEAAVAERVANLIVSQLLDFIEIGNDVAIAKTRAPASFYGRRLGEIDARDAYGVTFLAVSRPDGTVLPIAPDMVITEDCALVLEGSIDQVRRFATMS
ncbi:TrkA family potassium uptake protein [Micromonospora sp. HM5-17]|uniref:potassium channel family protein n=1 Tax=Micromonospora sp. HM5-17 TaxID=2487710 RepID=UPI001F331A43|nr:TrkA family potassium uptake protein [Micromonospora sp. HM5-17]